ncbi:hypothetical protein [Pontibacillus litoralis]|uniref:Uncharacterized protein n=1 Tax=Pontibacillus litoralis JSM 072002 TaxID=1385512 RepID=A0A0A5GD73_9BACI|nr:hypothetical protein [Pontibacillus litoralis]KGX89158.1 hypothetical protein N784_02190 [Pontibacillus litoralis JSM 072002]
MKKAQPKWIIASICVLAVFVVGILASLGVFTSEEGAIQKAKEASEQAFHNEPAEANKQLENVSLFLPSSMTIESQEANNLILQDGNQQYLLFYNPLEKPTSDVYFQTAKEAENLLTITEFENDDRYGYMSIVKIGDKRYELQVGIGGAKMTTESSKQSLASNAQDMMNIVSSVTHPEEE